MDQEIGLWVEKLQYIWLESTLTRLYLMPKNFPVVDDKNKVVRLSKYDGECWLFPTTLDCPSKNLLRVADAWPTTPRTLYKKYGPFSLRMEGKPQKIVKIPRVPELFWMREYHKTPIPQQFVGQNPKDIKSPLVSVRGGETYKNLWDLEAKTKVSRETVAKIHQQTLEGKGPYRYFWQSFKDKQAQKLGKQICLTSFDFWCL